VTDAPSVAAVVVDFDGTACMHDVAEHLLERFSDDDTWSEYDEAWERGELGSWDVIIEQDALLRADRDTMVRFAIEHCPIDPTFPGFVRGLADVGVGVSLASDGFGFYIEPLLSHVGLGDVEVVTNEQVWDERGRPGGIRFVNKHPVCTGCGTCKMNVVLSKRALGPVAFVGEGPSDRFGAIYADVVFAKDALVEICERDGVPFFRWNDFDDVRSVLESMRTIPTRNDPRVCPGWRTA